MRTLIIFATVLAATAANADTWRTTTQRNGSGWTTTTTRTEPAPSVVYTPKPTAEDIRRSDERSARWQERCKPVAGAPDANGIRRYVYAAPNCDTGE